MKTLRRLAPDPRPIGLDEVEGWAAEGRVQPPFSDSAIAFCAGLSDRLSRSDTPEIAALAFWLRRRSLERLRAEVRAEKPESVVLVPRGLVLHFPPANVATVFLYCWALSFLAGNRNLIRLSERRDDIADTLCRVLVEALDDDPAFAGNTMIVTYGHDDSVSAALSEASDMRVVWGGDETVAGMRRLPLRPLATELAFPDRRSLAVLSAERVLALDADGLRDLALDFYNDAFAFDQLACSSPRRVIWIGGEDIARAAGRAFFDALAAVVHEKNRHVVTATVLRKLTLAAGGLVDGAAENVRRHGNAVTVAEMGDPGKELEDFCGGGLFLESRAADIEQVARHLSRDDQTLTCFGLDPQALERLVAAAGQRCPDRIVPVGSALAFDRFWDGHDLIRAFTRSVRVPGASPSAEGPGAA